MERVLLALALAASSSTTGGFAPGGPTQVVTFQPTAVAGKPIRGSCFTNSIAVDRAGVWRCMTGNEIHDPCFSLVAWKHAVVCDANPATGRPGVVVKLTKPLPPEVKHGPPSPWLIQLDDGTVCEATTGTLPPVSGDPARWACATHDPKAQVFLSSVKPGTVWHAEMFELAPDPKHPQGFIRKDAHDVEIHAVWQ